MVIGYSRDGKAPDPRQQRRELVERFGPLVRRVARRIYRRLPDYARGFEEEDLVSVGVIGLLDAHKRYDAESGTRFESFAEYRVKGAILDEVRKHDFFPRRLRAEANKLERVEERLAGELGRAAQEEEVAEALEIGLDELARLRDRVAPYSFVAPEEHGPMLGGRVTPEVQLARKEQRGRLVELLKGLPERQQLILDLYFNRERTLTEIGALLDLSPGRISQLKTRALATLRERL